MSTAPESVAHHVERIALRTPTLPPATHTNGYLVGARRFYVVEPASPYPDVRDALAEAVRARIAAGDRLLGAVVTHHHGDHAGGASAFCETFQVPLLAHRETAARLHDVVVHRTLDEGDRLDVDDVVVLHTPGHAPGHLCLWSPEHRWMIVGDMIASVGTILIDVDDDGDMDVYLAQLARLRALEPQRLLPAHGAPVDDAVARLSFYIAHRTAREERVYEALGEAVSSLDTIAERAYADTPGAHPLLAARSALAHLARLVAHGRATREGDGWRRA